MFSIKLFNNMIKIFFIILLIFFLIILKKTSNNCIINDFLALILFYIICYSLIAFYFYKCEIKMKKAIGKFPKEFNWWKILAIVFIMILFSTASSTVVFYYLFSYFPSLYNEFINFETSANIASGSTYIFILERIVRVFAAPFIEELLFRGILLHKLAGKVNIKKAIILVSILFGVLHPKNIIFVFFFSVVLSILYIRTKNLIVPIALHVFNNAMVSIFLIIEKIFLSGEDVIYTEPVQIEVFLAEFETVLGPGIAIFILSLLWFIHFIFKNWSKLDNNLPLQRELKTSN